MVRPKRCRKIQSYPKIFYFKPQGIKLSELDIVTLTLDEFEALRLYHYEKKSQEDCAKSMNISQPTFSRILNSAYNKITKALIEGKAIRIESYDN